MATISQVADGAYDSFGGLPPSKLGQPFDGTLRSLTRLLRNSTIGVALFDGNLQCRAFNGTLGSMIGISVRKHIGKHLLQLYPGAVQLELAFRRVWTTRDSLSNLELTVPLTAGAEPRRWVVNFYPISDESGEVRLVAATFSEVTKERCVELKIGRLKDKFHSNVLREPSLFEEEFSEMSARTFEVVNRSVALLKSSVLLRFHASHTRLEAGLVRHALFLKANREQDSTLSCAPPNVVADPDFSGDQGSRDATDPTPGGPSPREREVLHFLADGKSNKEIGLILEISTRTVEAYRARIMTKLDLHSTAALVRYAIRNKIVEP